MENIYFSVSQNLGTLQYFFVTYVTKIKNLQCYILLDLYFIILCIVGRHIPDVHSWV